ncbi:MAG: hypothetical protein AAFX99_08305 [Myxococcota bacterium]
MMHEPDVERLQESMTLARVADTLHQGPAAPTRRTVLRGLLTAAGATALTAPWGWIPAQAEAKTRSRVVDISRGKTGVTLKLELAKGPYPGPGGPWKDATTWVYVPHHFRAIGNHIDTVLHFHGHGSVAEESMKLHQLREQLHDSRQNAILVIPQGPVRAKSSHFGKLNQPRGLLNFLTDLRKTLQSRDARRALRNARIQKSTRIGLLCISAHSGGYRAAARCAAVGRYDVNEIWLFDSLYGEVNTFCNWIAERRRSKKMRKRHKLVSYYAGGQVAAANKSLMRALDRLKIDYIHGREGKKRGELTRAQITKARVVFIQSRLTHRGVTHDLNNMRDCLYASCLKRRLKSDWFKHKNSTRRLEPRN